MTGLARKPKENGSDHRVVPAVAVKRLDSTDTALTVEVCAEDFDRIIECKDHPPNPSPAIIQANELHKRLLTRNS